MLHVVGTPCIKVVLIVKGSIPMLNICLCAIQVGPFGLVCCDGCAATVAGGCSGRYFLMASAGSSSDSGVPNAPCVVCIFWHGSNLCLDGCLVALTVLLQPCRMQNYPAA